MEIQTRDEYGSLDFFDNLKKAFAHADKDLSVWKISFNAEDGSRVRLVREGNSPGWKFEPITPEEMQELRENNTRI